MPFDPSTLSPEQRLAFLDDVRAAVEEGEGAQAAAVAANESPDLAAFLNLPYMLGEVAVRPLSVNSLATLEYLGNSCLAEDDGQEPDAWAVFEFLYVLSHEDPASLAASAYEHSRRLRLVRDSQAIAAKSPEYYREYLASLESITTRHFGQWDAQIQAFAARLQNVSVEDMRRVVENILADASRQAGRPPEDGQDAKKNA